MVLDEPQRSKERVDNALMEYQRSYEDAMASGAALPIQAQLMRDFDGILESCARAPLLCFQTLPTAQLAVQPMKVVRLEGRGMHTLRGQFDMRGATFPDGGRQAAGWRCWRQPGTGPSGFRLPW